MLHRLSEADVRRADYALPKGVPALEADPARTRRWFIASGVACVGLGALGVTLLGGGLPVASRDAMRERRLEWARRCASGPEHVLHEKADMFLSVVELHGADAVIWKGVERVARRALENSRAERAWAERVLTALDACRADMPPSLSGLHDQLGRALRARG